MHMLSSRLTRPWVWLAVAALCLAAAKAQAANQLRWKFKEGEQMPYALQQSASILIDANGIEIDVKLKQVIDTVWTVKSVDSEGNAELSQKMERIQLTMNTPFTGEVHYDSKKPDEQPPPELWDRIGKPIEAMLEGEFTMKVSPTGKVSDLKLPEKLTQALQEQRGGGAQSMMMGGGLFTENTIRQTIEQGVLILPEQGVGEGVTWSREYENKMGPLGTQKIAVTYSYGGKEKQNGKVLEKIASKTKVEFEPAEGGDIDAEMEITEQEGSGSVLFDSEAGKTVFSQNKQELTIEGDFMGNEFSQEITLVLMLKQGSSADLPADEPEKKEEASADSDDKDKKQDADKDDGDKKDKKADE
jgi:hypothetical protein